MFIVYEKIEISSIKKKYKTRNPLSSSVLSLNGLAIVCNKYDEIMISPEGKVDFLDEILKLNPEISVEF